MATVIIQLALASKLVKGIQQESGFLQPADVGFDVGVGTDGGGLKAPDRGLPGHRCRSPSSGRNSDRNKLGR